MLAGCGGGNALYVEVVTDLCPDVEGGPRCLEDRFDEVVVSLDRTSETTRAVETGDDYLEGQRVADFPNLEPGSYTITVELRRAEALVARSMRSVDVRSSAQVIQIVIQSDCAGVTCPGASDDPAATECVAGGCVDPRCFTPEAPAEGCGALCDESSPCVPSVPCADASCVEHLCIERMIDARCAEGERCIRELGCFGGVLEGDPCESADDCGETDFICCGNECRQPDCDDGNPCTDDACTRDGCVNAPVDSVCDDLIFCNGGDRCQAGACDMHTGNPCGFMVCDEAGDACVPCLADADCPPPSETFITGCSTESDLCDETGTQTWRVTSYRCVDRACAADMRDEPRACTVDRTGTRCSSDDSTCTGGACLCGGSACAFNQYCLAGGCFDYPTIEMIGHPSIDCVDAARGPDPGLLAGYRIYGRPGAIVHKYNRHASCAGALWEEAPETRDTVAMINASGVYEVLIDSPTPLPCDFPQHGRYEQYAEVDGQRIPPSGVIEQVFYNSGCGGALATCAGASSFCP